MYFERALDIIFLYRDTEGTFFSRRREMTTFSLQELQDNEDVICAVKEERLIILEGETPDETLLEEETVLSLLTKMSEG